MQPRSATDTSRTLLSPTATTAHLGYGDDDTGFNEIARGTRTTPLESAIPIVITTPPVPVRNYFGGLDVDAASDGSPDPDSSTTPLLSRVLAESPPPDVDANDTTAGRIVSALRQTAREADAIVLSTPPRRTLADALARLDEVESYVIESTERIATSMVRLTSTTNEMTGRLNAQDIIAQRLTSEMQAHSVHITHLMEFEQARRRQMDDHWQRLDDIEAVVKKTDAAIHGTNEAIMESARQNERLTAQLTGIRANAENAATAARTDITDLRARLIPDLRDATATLIDEIKTLHGHISSLDSSTLSRDAANLTASTAPGNIAPPPATSNVTPMSPPPHADVSTPNAGLPTQATSPPPRGSPRFETSWYHNANNPRFDDPSARDLDARRTENLHVDTAHNVTEPTFLGGRITSPRSTDKERQARLLKISRHDVAGLACFDYHGGPNGVKDLSLSFIHSCGYQTFPTEDIDDVLPCYGHIQLMHKKVRQAWYNPRTLQSGPSVDRILEKGLAVLPKLRATTAKDTVAFYERLQQVSAAYLIPLMPFDAICLKNNYEGLFPPGLGSDTYAECAAAVLEILPRLLPTSDTEIMAIVSSVANASRNGYDLLWRILELYVPGFDPTVPIAQPQWARDSTILEFCQSHLLYFRLQAKKGVFFTSRDRTNIFLRAVVSSEYADVITTVQTSVDTYRHPDDDGHLPDQFRISEIAMLVHNNAKHRVRDIHTPRIQRVSAPDWDDDDDATDPFFLVQGYCPQVNRIDRQPGDRTSGGRNVRFGDFGDRGARKDRTQDRGPTMGRYNRPDQRRRPFKPGVQCAACKRIGHEAANCDMLAIALFIDRYTKRDMSESERGDIETKWIGRWKEKLGMPAKTPRQVMRTYCDSNNITPEFLDLAMDWDCWPDSDLADE